MNRLLLCLILIGLLSCADNSDRKTIFKPTETMKTVQLKLIDSLGEVSLSIPIRYDTSFSWVHYSDCGKSCDEQKYRFQPKNLPVTKETGWLGVRERRDSIERLTISHSGYFPFHNGDTSRNDKRHQNLRDQLIATSEYPPLVFDTIERINDRYYSIFHMEQFDSVHTQTIIAFTTIKSNQLKFQFESIQRKKDSLSNLFQRNSLETIKSIRIGQGI
jgi:hypothetical protein